MSINWPELVDVIRCNERFLLTSHIRPDCDALGSELGMAEILLSMGKQVTIVNGHATPPNLAFIDPKNRIQHLGTDVQIEDLTGFDILIVLDTSAWAQLGPMGDVLRATTAKKIIIDHHVGSDDLDATPYKNTSAEAAGRIVTELAKELGVKLTAEIATPLFAAIATDTGWFRFKSVSACTYRIVASLIEAGASPDGIYKALYEQNSIGRVRLRGRILQRFETLNDGRLIHTYVKASDFTETGALPSDTEDVINAGLAVAGVEAAVILVGQVEGGFKISFRSQTDLDCSKLAGQFGGGGHKAAAGAFITESFEISQRKVLDATLAAMQ